MAHTIYHIIKFSRFWQILLVTCLITASVSVQGFAQDIERPQPEMATGTTTVQTAQSSSFMAVTANPHATKAAYDILKKGGSAVDAAIAAQLVLGLVEPQSSGLGGGAFALHYDAHTKALTSFDARETAPSLTGPFLFQENGTPMAFFDAVVGGRSVGVPGVPALLKDMHEAYGVLTWMELFDDAIKIAEEGFEVSPRLAKMIENAAPRLARSPQTASYFLPGGHPLKAGHLLKNPEYAHTLKEYRFYGPSKFYRGRFAKDVIKTVQNFETNPGLLNSNDFENYSVKMRDPVCGPYRAYIVCAMGEPSSGGLTVLQILGMLEPFDVTNDAQGWNLIAQASALAFADRNMYMADPDFVNTPGLALIDPDYLKSRSALITPDAPLKKAVAGNPEGWRGPLYETGNDIAKPGTSHISIRDKDGNIVSMTTTIEGAFGAHLMTNGFLLNNQLTDFSFAPFDVSRHPVGTREACSHERDPEKAGNKADGFVDPRCLNPPAADRGDDSRALVANMAEGGKRPRSSMTPAIIFDQAGNPVLIIGSAGGSHIIGYVLQQIIAMLDWGMSPQEAFALPNTTARGLKIDTEDAGLAQNLKAQGHNIEVKTLNSGLTAIRIQGDTLTGVADPRREGLALGD